MKYLTIDYFCPVEKAYLILGSNMGDRREYLQQSIAMLGEEGDRVLRQSALYQSEPWGFDDPVWFLNRAVELQTERNAQQLLDRLHYIEHHLGRVRTVGYAARTIDIDIALFGRQVIATPSLTVPHPLMSERRFVLMPLAELIPDMEHPLLHRTIRDLADRCKDSGKVFQIS